MHLDVFVTKSLYVAEDPEVMYDFNRCITPVDRGLARGSCTPPDLTKLDFFGALGCTIKKNPCRRKINLREIHEDR